MQGRKTAQKLNKFSRTLARDPALGKRYQVIARAKASNFKPGPHYASFLAPFRGVAQRAAPWGRNGATRWSPSGGLVERCSMIQVKGQWLSRQAAWFLCLCPARLFLETRLALSLRKLVDDVL